MLVERFALQRNWIPILVTLVLGLAFVVPAAARDENNNHECAAYGYAYGGAQENEQGDDDAQGDENQGDECEAEPDEAAEASEDQTSAGVEHDEDAPNTVKVTSSSSSTTKPHGESSSSKSGEDGNHSGGGGGGEDRDGD